MLLPPPLWASGQLWIYVESFRSPRCIVRTSRCYHREERCAEKDGFSSYPPRGWTPVSHSRLGSLPTWPEAHRCSPVLYKHPRQL